LIAHGGLDAATAYPDLTTISLSISVKAGVRFRIDLVFRLSNLDDVLGVFRLFVRADIQLAIVQRYAHFTAENRRAVANNDRAVRSNRIHRTVDHSNDRAAVGLGLNSVTCRDKGFLTDDDRLAG